jgi:hypothetical protein
MRSKQVQNPVRQTLNPIGPYLATRACGAVMWWYELPRAKATPFLCSGQALLLGWLHSLPLVFLGRYSSLFAFLTYQGLHCFFSFSQLPMPHSEAACRDTDPAPHCLASQVFLWNLCGNFHETITLTFCMPAKIALGQQCQCLPPALIVSGLLWTMAPVASVCLDNWWEILP